MGRHFPLIRIGRIFNAADNSGLEVLPLFGQFGNALRIRPLSLR